MPCRTEEKATAAEAIATLIAAEFVRDGDTLQMGPAMSQLPCIGVQTELIRGGVIDLVREGIVTVAGRKSLPARCWISV